MISRLLKKHPITVRNLRRETLAKHATAKTALAAFSGLALLTTLAAHPANVFAEEGIPVPPENATTISLSDLAPEVKSKIKAQHYAAQGQNIQQAYHQQLHANRQRSAFSAQQAAFQQSASSGQFAPASYQTPVAPATPHPAAHQAPSAPAAPAEDFPRTSNAGHTNPTPASGYAAQQTFMPPVHIPPPQYRGPGAPITGDRSGVHNFAPQATRSQTAPPAQTARRQPTRRRVKRNENRVQPQRQSAAAEPNKDTHVFLQDRIANALSRHFKRGKKPADREVATTPAVAETSEVAATAAQNTSQEIPQPIEIAPASTIETSPSNEIVFDDYQPLPVKSSLGDPITVVNEQFVDDQSYSEILENNQYASVVSNGVGVSSDRPQDHAIESRSNARRRSIDRAVHQYDDEETFEVSLGDEGSSLFDRYENIRQTSAEKELETRPAKRRRSSKSRTRVADNRRRDQYRPSNGVPADNVSVLFQENDDENPAISGSDDFSPQDDFKPLSDRELDEKTIRDRDVDSDDRPNLRDDLRDADDEDLNRSQRRRRDRDRVRSRLDDELDLEELDEDLDEDLDDEIDDDDFADDRPNRTPRKSCRQFQDELISGSIRDIALDISPPAASEGAQYGGLARTWTDRRGNTLATGALVDIRRGYVILDSGQKLAYARLSEADLAAVSDFWRLPEVCVIGNRGGSPYRNWTPQVVTWKASNLCHKPLYFENVQLERYGHSRGPIAQPIHSTLHFFVSLVSVPYQTGISPPNECEYALGFYRPGNCAPWLKDPIPISLEGIRREALFVTGAAFIP